MPTLTTKTMTLNMGPSHPSTHGVLRVVLELDGENILTAVPHVGYLHRGFEKIAESKPFNQFIPYTDRLDYLAPLSNNVAVATAFERLIGLEITPRCQYIRVIVAELARISSHLLGIGTMALDIGAMTVFFLTFREREDLYYLFESLTGTRMTTSYTRVGGLAADLPEGWTDQVRGFLDAFPAHVDEYERLLTGNEIWRKRTRGVAVLPPDVAIGLGVTGPNLRGSGVRWDLRRDQPYLVYDRFDFEVPVGTRGDAWDRYHVRVREMRESARIVRQALDALPGGPINSDDPRVSYPPKERVYASMEELIHHFKIASEGVTAPPGDSYASVENPKGELGFYLVGDGTNTPYRLKIRSPSFINLQVLPILAKGTLVADFIAVMSSLDIVLGEVDR